DDRSVRTGWSNGGSPMRLPQQEPALYPFPIRRMEPEDLAAGMSIQRGALRHPWSTELGPREVTPQWSPILLAEEPTPEGSMRLLGFSIFWLVQDELHILNVATAPEHRHRGVARAMLTATLDEARDRRCTVATLEVRRSNEAALKLYRS